jgi:hypothetical protein
MQKLRARPYAEAQPEAVLFPGILILPFAHLVMFYPGLAALPAVPAGIPQTPEGVSVVQIDCSCGNGVRHAVTSSAALLVAFVQGTQQSVSSTPANTLVCSGGISAYEAGGTLKLPLWQRRDLCGVF